MTSAINPSVPTQGEATTASVRANFATAANEITTLQNQVAAIATNPFNVKSYGAKGDGVTDDTAAIQAAVNQAGAIYFPAGRYKISSAIASPSGMPIAVTGNGTNETVILQVTPGADGWDHSSSQYFQMSSLSLMCNGVGGTALKLNFGSASVSWLTLRDVWIVGNGNQTTNFWHDGIIANNPSVMTLDHCSITGTNQGLLSTIGNAIYITPPVPPAPDTGSYMISFYNSYINYYQNGLVLDSTGHTANLQGIVLDWVNCEGCMQFVRVLGTCLELVLNKCQYEGFGSAIHAEGADTVSIRDSLFFFDPPGVMGITAQLPQDMVYASGGGNWWVKDNRWVVEASATVGWCFNLLNNFNNGTFRDNYFWTQSATASGCFNLQSGSPGTVNVSESGTAFSFWNSAWPKWVNWNAGVGNTCQFGALQTGSPPTGLNWQNQGVTIGWNYAGSQGETDFVNSQGGGSGGFNFYNVASTGTATPALLVSIDGSGNISAPNLPINVKSYGAKGDGVTDDTAAINAAIAYIRTNLTSSNEAFTLVIPKGLYLITSPLNFTGLNQSFAGVDIVGEGAILLGKMSGGAVIDAFTSRWLRFHNLAIEGSSITTPAIGIQIGAALGTPADYIEFHSVKVYGNFTFTPFYNLASETFACYSSEFRNSSSTSNTFCMVLDGINHWSAHSTFLTVTAPANTRLSFNGNSFIECTWQGTSNTAVLWMSSTTGHKFVNCYGSNSSTCFLKIYQPADSSPAVEFLDFDCHMETTGLVTGIQFTGPSGQTFSYVIDIHARDYACTASTSIFGIDSSSSLTAVDLRGARFELAGAPLFDTPSKWTCTAAYAYLGSSVFNALPGQWQGPVANMNYPGTIALPQTQRLVATNGGSVAIAAAVEWVELVPAAGIAGYTLTMPLAPGGGAAYGGTTITISTTQTITTLTLTPNTSQSVTPAPGTLTANTSITYRYDATSSSWLSLGRTSA